MSDEGGSDELLRAGLKDYPDAANALKMFENEVQEAAKAVLAERYSAMKEVASDADLDKQYPVYGGSRPLGEEIVFLGYGCPISLNPWAGFLCGVSWDYSTQKPQHLSPNACAAIVVTAAVRKRALCRSLIEAGARQGTVSEFGPKECRQAHAITVQFPFGAEPTREELHESLSDVSTRLLNLLQAAGGLNTAIGNAPAS